MVHFHLVTFLTEEAEEKAREEVDLRLKEET